jgi:hypothetical protein
MTDAILEAVIRELETARPLFFPYDVELLASSIIAAVTPLIRSTALEEAAVVAEGFLWKGDPNWVATAIRALKEQP